MTTVLTDKAQEGSTFVIPVAFKDEAGAAVVPNTNTIKWSLRSYHNAIPGAIINSRTDVAVASASSINITLTGDDLDIGENGDWRVVTVNWVYNSSYGSNLNGSEDIIFQIEDSMGN